MDLGGKSWEPNRKFPSNLDEKINGFVNLVILLVALVLDKRREFQTRDLMLIDESKLIFDKRKLLSNLRNK